jgi:hypothetical protein
MVKRSSIRLCASGDENFSRCMSERYLRDSGFCMLYRFLSISSSSTFVDVLYGV